MQIAGGVLHWTEAEFWSCSPVYFQSTLDGILEMHGKQAGNDIDAETYEQCKTEYAAELALSSDDLARIRAASGKRDER
jgi:hypothetical protein